MPPAAMLWRAIKRGKSARTTAPFILPYFALLALASFLIAGVRGVSLLTWMLVVVSFLMLAFYVYTEVLDVGFRFRKK